MWSLVHKLLDKSANGKTVANILQVSYLSSCPILQCNFFFFLSEALFFFVFVRHQTYMQKNTVVVFIIIQKCGCCVYDYHLLQFTKDLTEILFFCVHRTKMSLTPLLQLWLRPLLRRETVAAACQTFSVQCWKTPPLNTGLICLTLTVRSAQVSERQTLSVGIIFIQWITRDFLYNR